MTEQEIKSILSDVKYKDFTFCVKTVGFTGYVMYIEATETDHITGKPLVMQGRKFYIPNTMSKSDFVRTCFVAVMAWEEHEAREAFSYKGAAIFDPHFDVDEAAERARRYEHVQETDDPFPAGCRVQLTRSVYDVALGDILAGSLGTVMNEPYDLGNSPGRVVRFDTKSLNTWVFVSALKRSAN